MNILRVPVVGSFLRWRHARLALQILLLLTAAAAVLHGLLGPQLAPRNLATVLTSIHWRGFLIVAIVAAGNLFCTACPMVLARDIGRRVFHPVRRWPRRLRGKWLGLALLVAVLFSYELFDLWSQPRTTAWLVLGYFGAAIVVDTSFAGASFCKHLCPIGQFNFVASTMAPTELRIVDRETCRTCRTSDCIKGRYEIGGPAEAGHQAGHYVQRGCELGLFLPMKVGNLDCTMCLDCVHACPHDNIALTTRTPGAELLERGRRSGIGRLGQRADLATLAIVFTFAALVSAFAMTSPAYLVEQWIAVTLGVKSEWPVLALVFVVGLLVGPLALLAPAGAVTRLLAHNRDTRLRPSGASARHALRATVLTYAHGLIPIGLGIWLAHYGFHLLTGALTLVPVVQSAVVDTVGRALLGGPFWGWVGMQPGAVFPVQLGCVVLGTAGSLGMMHAISQRDQPTRPVLASAPWLVVVLVIAVTALWILSQPMEMRAVSVLG